MDELTELRRKYDDQAGFGPQTDAIVDQLFEILSKHTYHGANEAILGALFHKLGDSYHVDRTLERYWAHVVAQYFPILEKIHAALIEQGYTADQRFNFNDLDDDVWYIPLESLPKSEFHIPLDRKAFVHRSQNFNLLFIWEQNEHLADTLKLHIRRYWDKFERDEQDEVKFQQRATEHGRLAWLAEKNMDWYANDVLDNQYFDKPSLDYFVNSNFVPRYADSRDKGYILTYNRYNNEVDDAIHYQNMLNNIFGCFLPSIECALLEEEN